MENKYTRALHELIPKITNKIKKTGKHSGKTQRSLNKKSGMKIQGAEGKNLKQIESRTV